MIDVFGIDGFEGVFTIVPLLFWAAVVAALGWVVRRAVRQGRALADERQRRPVEPDPTSSTWQR